MMVKSQKSKKRKFSDDESVSILRALNQGISEEWSKTKEKEADYWLKLNDITDILKLKAIGKKFSIIPTAKIKRLVTSMSNEELNKTLVKLAIGQNIMDTFILLLFEKAKESVDIFTKKKYMELHESIIEELNILKDENKSIYRKKDRVVNQEFQKKLVELIES